MSATRLYRIAAVLFVLFAAAHTFGFLRFKPPTEEGMAVLNAMNTVHFAGFSYGGFYVGFGLYVSVYMIFSAFLAWHLSNVATLYPQSIGALDRGRSRPQPSGSGGTSRTRLTRGPR